MKRKNWHKWRKACYLFLFTLINLIIITCNNLSNRNLSQQANQPNTEFNQLKIWWDKGYIQEEDEIIQNIINNWKQKNNYQVKLSFYTPDKITQTAKRAIEAGNSPDVLFSSRAEYTLLAWEGKLEDVSDVIKPVENLYSPTALKAAYLYNNVKKKRSYYAVPLHQATIHIFYWQDLLEKLGKSAKDIPHDWEQFWAFWKSLPKQIEVEEEQGIYAVGMPMSIEASDTYYLFEQILEAYDVKILDSEGKLLVDNPQVRQNIIDCLRWYTAFYQQEYVPKDAVQWLDPDNNRNFLNRVVVMTPNPTLSIATALRKDEETYFHKLGISEFPNKPSGKPMRHLVSVRQAVVLAEAKNKKIAKEFLAYLIQPEIIEDYLRSAGGRYVPVMTAARQDKFWTNKSDPHVSTATKTLIEGKTRLFYSVQNPIYSKVLEQNVWGQAIKKIAVDGVSPEQATNEAIEKIKKIFNEWQYNYFYTNSP